MFKTFIIDNKLVKGLVEIQPQIYTDIRGHFFECFQEHFIKNAILYAQGNPVIIPSQDNQSFSYKGVIRGLHFQKPPFGQAKLVRVITGKALDTVVDLRKDSETYGKVVQVELTTKNMLYIPHGFAHGFSALEDCIFHYKCFNCFYNAESESGIRYDDPELNIDWKIENPIVSEKDLKLPFFSDIKQTN